MWSLENGVSVVLLEGVGPRCQCLILVCSRSRLGPDSVLLDVENAHSRTVVPDR